MHIDWVMVGSIAVAVQVVILAIASVFALLQLREVAATRSGALLARVIDELSTAEMTEAKAWVLSDEFPMLGKQSAADDARIRHVSYRFNRIGLFVRHGLIPREIVLDMYCVEIVNCWDRLEPFVMGVRRTINFDGYQNQFQELNERACSFTSKHYPLPRGHRFKRNHGS